jgi:hypothetical protein
MEKFIGLLGQTLTQTDKRSYFCCPLPSPKREKGQFFVFEMRRTARDALRSQRTPHKISYHRL